jgi:hypothetical protein
MRPGGVPARRVEHQFHGVGGRGDGSDPHPDPADLEPGIAVQGEHPRDVVHRTRGDHIDGTAGHDLLGVLEDQPDADRQFVHLGEGQGGAEQDRGVRVVTAGVGYPGDGRGERPAGVLLQRERIHIGAQGQAWPRRADIADQTGAGGQFARFQTGLHQPGLDEFGGAVLGAGQFRIGVDVAAPADQIVTVVTQPRLDRRLSGRDLRLPSGREPGVPTRAGLRAQRLALQARCGRLALQARGCCCAARRRGRARTGRGVVLRTGGGIVAATRRGISFAARR